MAEPESTIVAAARAGEPDRYLAALLAGPEERDALIALAAFSAELGWVPHRATEPAIAEIRLQWWREALVLPTPLRTGNPVADTVREAAYRHGLSIDLLAGPVDGHELLLRRGAAVEDQAFNDVLWKTEGTLFLLAAQLTGLGTDAEIRGVCAAAGRAYGLSRLLLELPQALAQGRVPLGMAQLEAAAVTAERLLAGADAADLAKLLAQCAAQARQALAEVRPVVSSLPRARRTAFLPLALVEAYLRAAGRRDGPTVAGGVVPIARVCRIAAAHLLGRV